MINQPSPQPAAQEPSPASGAAPFIIRPQLDADIAAIVAFSLRAWQPVFESMASVLGPRLTGSFTRTGPRPRPALSRKYAGTST